MHASCNGVLVGYPLAIAAVSIFVVNEVQRVVDVAPHQVVILANVQDLSVSITKKYLCELEEKKTMLHEKTLAGLCYCRTRNLCEVNQI